MNEHLWITAPARRDREALAASLGLPAAVDAHRRLRGPYTAAGALLRALAPEQLAGHDIEVLTAAPELEGVIECKRASLTWTSAADERTRFYPRAHTTRVAHGLTELFAAACAGGTVVFENVDEADHTDRELIDIMLRRIDPGVLRMIICTGEAPPPGVRHLEAPPVAKLDGTAADYVDGDCTEPALRTAYEALAPHERAALHDARAVALEARGDASLKLGAIPFHREHGSDPEAGASALTAALERCVLLGFYHAVLDLAPRALALLDWDADPEACWLVVAKLTTAQTALGLPDDAADWYDRACAATSNASVHLQAAYGRAMLYTRFYQDERRDHLKAKAHINTAIAIAAQMPESASRAFNLTFQENGLALIEMHLGDGRRALKLVTDGLKRMEAELAPGRQTLHRSVLRYNRAQLLARMGPPEAALAEYTAAIEADPHHSEYYFERAAVQRKLGRTDAALADYAEAIRLSPPYPEPHYNRAELLLELGRTDAALADLGYVIELDPGFVDAYVNRAAALIELGELDAARRDVRAGLALDPAQPHLHSLRAMIAWQDGDFATAHAAFQAAIESDPTLVAAWSNRAVLYFEQGAVEESIACLDRAIALDDDPVLRANRELAMASRA